MQLNYLYYSDNHFKPVCALHAIYLISVAFNKFQSLSGYCAMMELCVCSWNVNFRHFCTPKDYSGNTVYSLHVCLVEMEIMHKTNYIDMPMQIHRCYDES